MDRRLLFPAVAVTAWAQQSSPEAVAAEKALRERVQQFYQLQQDGKHREAEAMVADDTKDLYYNAKKPDVRGFTIDKVQLLDGNTKAKVIIKAKVLVLMPGAGAQVFDMPSPTEWKIENGEWRWYISEEAKAATPFGNMKMGEHGTLDNTLDNKGAAPGGIANPDLRALEGQLSIDRTSVEFTADSPDQTLTITNGLPGPIDLRVDPHADTIKGLTLKVDKMHLDAGEKALVSLRWKGSIPMSDFVQITANPFSKVFTITMTGK
jgi:hypothetical protein